MSKINREKALNLYKEGSTYEEIGRAFGATRQAAQRSICDLVRLKGIARPTLTLEDRFWERVNKTAGCWYWTGGKTKAGYGKFSCGHGKVVYAHRFSKGLREPLVKGLTIDHLCRVRHCVNPEHLEQVSLLENLKRAPKHLVRGDFRYVPGASNCP